MAIFHFHAQILGRGPGRRTQTGALKTRSDNVVAAAAYRSGQRLTDTSGERSKVQDYSKRRGVAHEEIMLPENAASWLSDRERLWNTVEKMEKRKDAQLARELDIALPHELTHSQRLDLVRTFVATHFVSRGMVADFALHNPVEDKGDDRRNYHAHIMLTLRRATKDGLDPVKTREWNARENLNLWREAWQDLANRTLERHGHKSRIDHRTLSAQAEAALARGDRKEAAGLDRVPEIHVGPRPRAMEKRKVRPRSRDRETGARRRQKTRDEHAAARALARQVRREKERRRRHEARRDAWQHELEKKREWREAAYQEWLEERREKSAREWARKREMQRLDRLSFLKETGRPVKARPLTPSEAAKVKAWRKEQALARLTTGPATRRVREYSKYDKGPRIGVLWDILTGNNQKAKADIARIDAASARFMRWLDYWDRKITWLAEGKIGGAKFRRERWLQSLSEREAAAKIDARIAHARKRAQQMRDLTAELRGVVSVLMGRQEHVLVRRRQVEGWIRPPTRQQERGRDAPRGRERNT